MNIIPQRDKLLVTPLEKKTTSAIIVMSNDNDKPEQGRVTAVGQDVRDLKVGDQVLFKKYSPDEFKLDGVTYLILAEEDILATIEE